MSLLGKENIVNVYRKNVKKSIYFSERIDLFVVLSVFVLIITPVIINFAFKPNTGSNKKRTELFLSPRCEELFGRERTKKLLSDFGELNPDLRVKLPNVQDEKEGRGSPPDILIFDESDFSGLVADGALMSLEPYSGYETETPQLAIPLVSFMDLLFYNIDVLKAAGFDRPPKTRDEFLSYAKTVSSGGNAASAAAGAAAGLSPKDRQAVSRDIFSWIWSDGGDFWQAEDMPVINSRPLIADISFFGRLYREGALAPNSFEMTGDQRLEEFAQGKVAMMIASTRAIPYLREKMGDDAFGITTIPGSGVAGKYNIGLSGFYAGIGVSCTHPDKALNFLAFLAEQSPLLCAELKAVPGNVLNFIPGDYVKDDPFYSKARDIFESSEIIRGFSKMPAAEEFETAVREEIQIFFESGRTARETAEAIQRRWDAVLARD